MFHSLVCVIVSNKMKESYDWMLLWTLISSLNKTVKEVYIYHICGGLVVLVEAVLYVTGNQSWSDLILCPLRVLKFSSQRKIFTFRQKRQN